jgi:hypothetical protein
MPLQHNPLLTSSRQLAALQVKTPIIWSAKSAATFKMRVLDPGRRPACILAKEQTQLRGISGQRCAFRTNADNPGLLTLVTN